MLEDYLRKTEKESKNLKKQEIHDIQNKLDKDCFQLDMAYGDFKDFTKRTAFDKILHDKAFNIAKIRNAMDINTDLLQLSIIFLIKKLLAAVLKMGIHQTSILRT